MPKKAKTPPSLTQSTSYKEARQSKQQKQYGSSMGVTPPTPSDPIKSEAPNLSDTPKPEPIDTFGKLPPENREKVISPKIELDLEGVLSQLTPNSVAARRNKKARELATTTLQEICDELVETLLLEPDVATMAYSFGNLPEDIVGQVLENLISLGWRIHFDGLKTIEIETPQIAYICAPQAPKHISTIQPL